MLILSIRAIQMFRNIVTLYLHSMNLVYSYISLEGWVVFARTMRTGIEDPNLSHALLNSFSIFVLVNTSNV